MINHLSNDKDSKVNIHKAKNEIVSKEYESTENTTIIDNRTINILIKNAKDSDKIKTIKE